MLTEEEKTYLRQAFNAAIKSSADAVAAALVLLPLLDKLLATKNEDKASGDFDNK